MASSVKCRSMPSVASSACCCRIMLFSGSVRMRMKSSFLRACAHVSLCIAQLEAHAIGSYDSCVAPAWTLHRVQALQPRIGCIKHPTPRMQRYQPARSRMGREGART